MLGFFFPKVKTNDELGAEKQQRNNSGTGSWRGWGRGAGLKDVRR